MADTKENLGNQVLFASEAEAFVQSLEELSITEIGGPRFVVLIDLILLNNDKIPLHAHMLLF